LNPGVSRGKNRGNLITTVANNLLSALVCKTAVSNGASVRKLHDGDQLYLWVYADGRKYWRMRYWQSGKEKSLSVGVYPKVPLGDARKKRDEVRLLLLNRSERVKRHYQSQQGSQTN
jgi:hypothetical protein